MFALDPNYSQLTKIHLVKNVIKSNDNLVVGLNMFEKEYSFYDDMIGLDYKVPAYSHKLLEVKIGLYGERVIHER